jgi:hypothetical protein
MLAGSLVAAKEVAFQEGLSCRELVKKNSMV